MLAAQTILSARSAETAAIGAVLLNRSAPTESVIFIDSGRVVLGVLGVDAAPGSVEHQLGVVDGPGLGVGCDVAGAAHLDGVGDEAEGGHFARC